MFLEIQHLTKWVSWNNGDEREFDYNPERIPNPGMGIISGLGIISEAVQIFPRRWSTTKEWRNWQVT